MPDKSRCPQCNADITKEGSITVSEKRTYPGQFVKKDSAPGVEVDWPAASESEFEFNCSNCGQALKMSVTE